MPTPVVPHAGTWIEIVVPHTHPAAPQSVVPHAGTWIEIIQFPECELWHTQSFPTRERGLKYIHTSDFLNLRQVVPHAGTWIEIPTDVKKMLNMKVVPHAGTWIEIYVP